MSVRTGSQQTVGSQPRQRGSGRLVGVGLDYFHEGWNSFLGNRVRQELDSGPKTLSLKELSLGFVPSSVSHGHI